MPCNFYNAPPGSDVLCSTLHWVELRVTALQFAPPPLYWQTQNWLRHPIPALYHLPMMLRSVIFMLCCAMLATLYHPSNMIRFASTCYFHAISSTDNTSSSLMAGWPYSNYIALFKLLYQLAERRFEILSSQGQCHQ